MNPSEVSIYAVGDVIPDRPNPESLFELALPSLKQADILFRAVRRQPFRERRASNAGIIPAVDGGSVLRECLASPTRAST